MIIEKIRLGVFETNSSSSHSISIPVNTDGKSFSIMDFHGGAFCVESGCFGWGLEVYNNFSEKLSYLVSYLIDSRDGNLTFNFLDKIKTLFHIEELFIDNLRSDSFVKDVVCSDSADRYYIDHESHEFARNLLLQSDEELIKFLCDPAEVLVIHNDNSYDYEFLSEDEFEKWKRGDHKCYRPAYSHSLMEYIEEPISYEEVIKEVPDMEFPKVFIPEFGWYYYF